MIWGWSKPKSAREMRRREWRVQVARLQAELNIDRRTASEMLQQMGLSWRLPG